MVFSADEIDPGTLRIGGRLELECYHHLLGRDWRVSDTGYKGIVKDFTLNRSTPSSHDTETVFGQNLFVDVGFRPIKNLTADLGFEFINDYADRYWMPVNYEHRMRADGIRASWIRADIRYTQWNQLMRYFRGSGHLSWNDDDLFGLFPEHMDTLTYRRVAGRFLPEGWQINLKGKAGTLDFFAGPEVLWDFRDGIFLNYGFKPFGHETHLIYRDAIIPFGYPDERMRTGEISTRFSLFANPAQAAVLFQPFRLNRDYVYTEDTRPGDGLGGSRYLRRIGTTGMSDAFGFSLKHDVKRFLYFDAMMWKYTYQGLVAGNKNQLEARLDRKFSSVLTGSLYGTYRRPLIGPLPLVVEGTPANPGPALFEPRGPDSPFWVGWENPPTGFENREMNQYRLTMTFDPTPDSWFYKYQPGILEDWNLNPDEDARISAVAIASLTRYPGSTDRLLYWDENGHMIWEPALMAGPWATNGYLGSFRLFVKLNLAPWQFILDGETGESPARNSFSYTTSTEWNKPVTAYLILGASARSGPWQMGVRYFQDYWGPEDWHSRFGMTYDRLYRFFVSNDITDRVNFRLEYTRAREIDDRYIASQLGQYDEFRCLWTIKFGPALVLFGQGEKQARPYVPSQDVYAPIVSLSIDPSVITPDGDGFADSAVMTPRANDPSGISRWIIALRSPTGTVVKTFRGQGDPPDTITWDGTDDVYGRVVPAGIYPVSFSATDGSGNVATADEQTVTVSSRPAYVPREVTMENTDQGLRLSLKASVLFDTAKYNLKTKAKVAIREIIYIIAAYPDNRILVEGHTDNRGGESYNQVLSEQRAKSVAEALTMGGVASSRISTVGYGKTRPVTTNATAEGREANRRVEVIILKKGL